MSTSEKFWDKTASNYDQLEKKDEQTYIHIIESTKTHLKTSDVVLDFGCATGRISNEMAKYVTEIHGIDTSANMIGIAENKAKESNITNINYAHTTIFDERYKEGTFDVILVFHVLHLLDDAPIALQRMNELLKPGGLLITATPCVGEKIFLKSLLSFAGRVGFAPKIQSFKLPHLIDTIEGGHFSIIETNGLRKSSQEYYIVARKI
ncbi:class I SAM-dependent methyltransferase [Paenibacillus paeoniae]|nr:class I SAM-dependent methyltransferase [Paenibacillus paeoniae]